MSRVCTILINALTSFRIYNRQIISRMNMKMRLSTEGIKGSGGEGNSGLGSDENTMIVYDNSDNDSVTAITHNDWPLSNSERNDGDTNNKLQGTLIPSLRGRISIMSFGCD